MTKISTQYISAMEQYHNRFGTSIIKVCNNIDDRKNNNLPAALIETERLIIKNTGMEDENDIYELFSNPEIMTRECFGRPMSINATFERLKEWEKEWNENNPFSCFSIYTKNRELIGNVQLNESSGEGNLRITIMIKPEFQNIKYAQEAGGAIIFDWLCYILLNRTKLYDDTFPKRIEIHTKEENEKAIHLSQKAGFESHEAQDLRYNMKYYALNLYEETDLTGDAEYLRNDLDC